MSAQSAFIAIFTAQVFVMSTVSLCRRRGLWREVRTAAVAVFVLEVVYVSLALLVAGAI